MDWNTIVFRWRKLNKRKIGNGKYKSQPRTNKGETTVDLNQISFYFLLCWQCVVHSGGPHHLPPHPLFPADLNQISHVEWRVSSSQNHNSDNWAPFFSSLFHSQQQSPTLAYLTSSKSPKSLFCSSGLLLLPESRLPSYLV